MFLCDVVIPFRLHASCGHQTYPQTRNQGSENCTTQTSGRQVKLSISGLGTRAFAESDVGPPIRIVGDPGAGSGDGMVPSVRSVSVTACRAAVSLLFLMHNRCLFSGRAACCMLLFPVGLASCSDFSVVHRILLNKLASLTSVPPVRYELETIDTQFLVSRRLEIGARVGASLLRSRFLRSAYLSSTRQRQCCRMYPTEAELCRLGAVAECVVFPIPDFWTGWPGREAFCQRNSVSMLDRKPLGSSLPYITRHRTLLWEVTSMCRMGLLAWVTVYGHELVDIPIAERALRRNFLV